MQKDKALESALAQIEKAFGNGSIMKLGDKEKMEIEAISSGSLSLDLALGVGAVSYTHLDVYKRQMLKCGVFKFMTKVFTNYLSACNAR